MVPATTLLTKMGRPHNGLQLISAKSPVELALCVCHMNL